MRTPVSIHWERETLEAAGGPTETAQEKLRIHLAGFLHTDFFTHEVSKFKESSWPWSSSAADGRNLGIIQSRFKVAFETAAKLL
jgi:hypothetical protein